jgi:TusE/DsrC/DsvC family sulfur relay protein
MGYTPVGLKEKIMEMYPEIIQHGIVMGLDFNEELGSYVVTLRKGARMLTTHIEKKDADECMDGIKCLYIGVQIGQFMENFGQKTTPKVDISVLECADKPVSVDNEGYLVNYHDWNEKVAAAMAAKEGITKLTKEQLDILKFIRNHYEQFNYFPVVKAVCRDLHQGKNCVSEQFISPMLAWKLAGLPKPDAVVVNLLEHNEPPT